MHLPFWTFILLLVLMFFGWSFAFGLMREHAKRTRLLERTQANRIEAIREANQEEITKLLKHLKEAQSSLAAYKGHQTRSANAMLTGKSMPTKPVPKAKPYVIHEQP